jgi:uncharacterized protein with ATP-grasp and redox domains
MEIVEEVTGNGDPYEDFKKRINQKGEKLFSIVSKMVEENSDSLWAACKAAVMGNLMDVIGGPSLEFADNAESLFEKPFALDHFNDFRSVLEKAHKMVCLADNAGEVFFDRIFIQKVNIPTDYFVKGFPFLNDAEYEDAVLAQIDQVATIRTVELIKPILLDPKYLYGIYADFLDAAQKADLIVIKGQANYELFMSLLKGAFYLFVHKCPVIAQKERGNIGDAVFLRK